MTVRQWLTARYQRSATARLAALLGVCLVGNAGMFAIVAAQQATEAPQWLGVTLLLAWIILASVLFTWLFTARLDET